MSARSLYFSELREKVREYFGWVFFGSVMSDRGHRKFRHGLNLSVFLSNHFLRVFQFQLSNKDLKSRTGSRRVVQILATTNLAAWIGVAILFWLGLSSLNNLLIVFAVFFLVYLI